MTTRESVEFVQRKRLYLCVVVAPSGHFSEYRQPHGCAGVLARVQCRVAPPGINSYLIRTRGHGRAMLYPRYADADKSVLTEADFDEALPSIEFRG
jgi:hypothetical protein